MSLLVVINVVSKLRTSLMCVGLIGNVISFVIFSRKTFYQNSINIYFRPLIISATIYLVVQLIGDFAGFAGVYLYNTSNGLCKFSFYIYISMPPINGWILAAFSLDRAASVWNINKQNRILSLIRHRLFPWISIASIVVVNLLIYVTVPIYLNTVRYISPISNSTNQTQTTYICNINTVDLVLVFNYLFLIESSLLPFVVMLSATLVITKVLYTSRSKLFTTNNQVGNANKNANNQRRMRDRKFALTSAVLSVFYILFQLPIIFTYLINIPDAMSFNLFYMCGVISLNMNLTMPFIIFLVSNSIFRREFFQLFRLRSK